MSRPHISSHEARSNPRKLFWWCLVALVGVALLVIQMCEIGAGAPPSPPAADQPETPLQEGVVDAAHGIKRTAVGAEGDTLVIPAGSISGRVVDASRNGIADVCILAGQSSECQALESENRALFHMSRLLETAVSSEKFRRIKLSTSDASGRFVIPEAAEKALFAHAEFGVRLCELPSLDKDKEWVIVLRRCPAVYGTVVGLEAATKMQVFRDKKHIMAVPVTSDGTMGSFRTPRLLPGTYWLRIANQTRRNVVVEYGSPDVNVNFELADSSWSAYLTDRNQQAYNAARIRSEFGVDVSSVRFLTTSEIPSFGACVDKSLGSVTYDPATAKLSASLMPTAKYVSLWSGWSLIGTALIERHRQHALLTPAGLGVGAVVTVSIGSRSAVSVADCRAEFGLLSLDGFIVGKSSIAGGNVIRMELPAWLCDCAGWLCVSSAGHAPVWRRIRTPSPGGESSLDLFLSEAQNSVSIVSPQPMIAIAVRPSGEWVSGVRKPMVLRKGENIVEGLPSGPIVVLAWDSNMFASSVTAVESGSASTVELVPEKGVSVTVTARGASGVSLRCYGPENMVFDGLLAGRRVFGGPASVMVPKSTSRIEFVTDQGEVMPHEVVLKGSYVVR